MDHRQTRSRADSPLGRIRCIEKILSRSRSRAPGWTRASTAAVCGSRDGSRSYTTAIHNLLAINGQGNHFGVPRIASLFRKNLGRAIDRRMPKAIDLIPNVKQMPGPIVGAGIPGLMTALFGMFGLASLTLIGVLGAALICWAIAYLMRFAFEGRHNPCPLACRR
jgi:hypothetical protein